MANNIDPDQMVLQEQSDLGPYCLDILFLLQKLLYKTLGQLITVLRHHVLKKLKPYQTPKPNSHPLDIPHPPRG